MGSVIATKYQYAIESVRGTVVAAARVLGAAPKAVPMDRIWEQYKLNDGNRAEFSHHSNDQLLVEDSLIFDAQRPLYYQILPALVQCCTDGTITPAEQTGGQGDYKWDNAPSMTAANAPDTWSLQMGDDIQAYVLEYLMFKSLKFDWTIPVDGTASPVTGEMAYFARQVTKTSFTGSLVLPPSLEFLNGKLTRLYANATWGTVGNSEVASGIRGGSLQIVTGNEHKPLGGANKYFSTHGEGKLGTRLTLDLEGNAAGSAFFDSYQSGDRLAIRLDFNGAQIGSGVTSLFRHDMMMLVKECKPINQQIGSNNLYQVVLQGERDASGNFYDSDIITTLSTP